MGKPYIVVFDGECNFCNEAVNFIIKRDPEIVFNFSPSQSDFAQALMKEYQVEHLADDTFLLIKPAGNIGFRKGNDWISGQGRCYLRSDAALEVARELAGFWFLLLAFRIVPRRLRDAVYGIIARNRYRWFGRRDSCMVPTEDLRKRFVGI